METKTDRRRDSSATFGSHQKSGNIEAQGCNGPNSLSVWRLGTPPPSPQNLNQGQGQSHRWTQSNSFRLRFNQNCQTSGHAKTSQRNSFHKHLSRSKKMHVMAGLYSHICFIGMRLYGQWVRRCQHRQILYSLCISPIYHRKPGSQTADVPCQMSWGAADVDTNNNHTSIKKFENLNLNSITITVRPCPPKVIALFLSRSKSTKTNLSS